MRPDNDPSPRNPKPPARPRGEKSRGSSNSASGLPRVSASIRARTFSSRGALMTDARAPAHRHPAIPRAAVPTVRPAPGPGGLTLREQEDDRIGRQGAERRTRAPAPRIDRATGRRRQGRPADAPPPRRTTSSSTARLTRNRSGCAPELKPNAISRGVALRRGQSIAAVQQSHAQLVQPSERELHLPFRADRTTHATALGLLGGVVQEGRLADAGLAAHHQHRALLLVRRREQPIQARTLAPATGQQRLRARTRQPPETARTSGPPTGQPSRCSSAVSRKSRVRMPTRASTPMETTLPSRPHPGEQMSPGRE